MKILGGINPEKTRSNLREGTRRIDPLFNAGSGWRTLTCVLVYVYAYAIGYSYYSCLLYTSDAADE